MEFVLGEHNVSLWLYILFKIVLVSFEFVPVQNCDVDPDEKIVHFNIFSFLLEWAIKHEIY